MSRYNPAEAPIPAELSDAPAIRTEYDVIFTWSFYGETKRRSWSFNAESEARAKVAELLRSAGPEYVWLVRRDETSLPLAKQEEQDDPQLAPHNEACEVET